MQATMQYMRYSADGDFLFAEDQNLLAQAAQMLGHALTDNERAKIVAAIKAARPNTLSEDALRAVVDALHQPAPARVRGRQTVFI